MRKYVMSNEEKKFLKSYDITKFNRPSLTADIAVFAILQGEASSEYRKDPEQKLGVLLIKRGDFPYKDYWALPGGFAQQGEELRDTALRELREETGVDSAFIEPFGLFSAASCGRTRLRLMRFSPRLARRTMNSRMRHPKPYPASAPGVI